MTPSLEKCLLEDDYILVLWSLDTRDWENKSTAHIVQTVLDRVQPGDIILMHDYIGHNSKTPEALEKIIPILLSQGYEFVTVSALLGIG
jgi:peptidoglycan/xylan/chitin deacetylase (PgdA/CDA1 family)